MSRRDFSLNSALFRHAHNRWLGAASEAAAPLLRLAASGVTGRKTSPPSEWRRGLILSHNHMGDVLYRTCSLPALRAGLPHCNWSFLTSPASADVLNGNPDVHEVLPWNTNEDSWGLSPGSFPRLRERDFDVVLCSNSLRYYPDLLLATAVGAPNRVAFTHKGLSGLVTHPVDIDFPSAYAAYFRSIVASVTGTDGDWPLRPRVFPDDHAEAAAAEVWLRGGLDKGAPVIACSITTRQKSGNFPGDTILDILVAAREHAAFRVALLGTLGDRETLAQFAARLGKDAVVIAGDLTIRGLAAFIRRCALLLTLDSGPRHLGNAVGVPVFFARNMSHSRTEAGVYCDTEIDIAPEGEYLSDEQIMRMARMVSPAAVASRIVAAMRGGEAPPR